MRDRPSDEVLSELRELLKRFEASAAGQEPRDIAHVTDAAGLTAPPPG